MQENDNGINALRNKSPVSLRSNKVDILNIPTEKFTEGENEESVDKENNIIAEDEELSLLSEIFPDLSREELIDIHYNRVKEYANHDTCSSHASNCELKVECNNDRIASYNSKSSAAGETVTDLSEDRKPRIPQHIRVKNEEDRLEWMSLSDLQHHVICQHSIHDQKYELGEHKPSPLDFTVVLSRDSSGLGMQLRESNGFIWAQALICHDGVRIINVESYHVVVKNKNKEMHQTGPACEAGIQPGDCILGVNGRPFLQWTLVSDIKNEKNQSLITPSELLTEAAYFIKNLDDPIVVHIRRFGNNISSFNHHEHRNYVEEKFELTGSPTLLVETETGKTTTDERHLLAKKLLERGLLHSQNDEISLSNMLNLFSERARQWSTTAYLTINTNNQKLFSGQRSRQLLQSPFETRRNGENVIDPNLIRKALCVRIVNTFSDKGRIAYTIWVYDVESQMEWYAPVRYFDDFKDLRAATMQFSEYISNISFPKSASWFVGEEASESRSSKEIRCKQLEDFLRELCTMIYKTRPHPLIAEVALYLQTFLGCNYCDGTSLLPYHNVATSKKSFFKNELTKSHNNAQEKARNLLKQCIQLYCYRVFLLPTFNELVSHFVTDIKNDEINTVQRKVLESKNITVQKERIIKYLGKIKIFLDNLQNLIIDGCKNDFDVISEQNEFEVLKPLMVGNKNECYRETLYMEVVREQVELEVYVPLRSTISKQLVNGWYQDDLELNFKVQALRNKSQTFFNIDPKHISSSEWNSVSRIILEGIGLSTLPCTKLRAILYAAKEIMRLNKEEKTEGRLIASHLIEGKGLGADVKAGLDKPNALCILLLNLCDPSKEMGEIGYYLASFEAVISHIKELELNSD